MATADTQALQQLINKITELKAQISEAEVAKKKLDHRMAESLVAGAEPTGGMFDQMKKNFFDPVSKEIKELKQELQSLQQEMISGSGQLALPGPSGKIGMHGTDDSATRISTIARESDDLAQLSGRNFLKEYHEKWRDIGKVVPEVTHELK